jgi:hypothetical protein
MIANFEAALKVLDAGRITADVKAGNLYSVKIHGDKTADELNFMRWDKPLTEGQKQSVRAGLYKVRDELSGYHWNSVNFSLIGETHGALLYERLDSALGSPKAASEFVPASRRHRRHPVPHRLQVEG